MTIGVIGGGISGLAAANALLDAGEDVQLIEGGRRPGGLVHTELTEEGLLIDHGPDSIAASAPGAREAMARLGLERQTVRPRGRAWLLQGEALQPLPAGLLAMDPGVGWEMLRSPLFSARGKLRFLAEPFAPTRRTEADESVATFFERRFGSEVADRLVDPLLGGIYRCDTRELSMSATMPHLREAERRDGSLTKGVLRTLARRRPGPKRAPLVGLRFGMRTLTHELASRLDGRLTVGRPARTLEYSPRGWVVGFGDGSRVRFEALILAVPCWVAAELLAYAAPDLASDLSAVESSGVHSVVLAWPRAQVPHSMEGSGFLVPRHTGRVLQACTWISEKWPDRAPEDVALMRVFLRSVEEADDKELIALARDEVREVLGVRAEPTFTKVLRRQRALPRYRVGHRERVAALRERLQELPRLALVGNGYDGIGMPACIASGVAGAASVVRA